MKRLNLGGEFRFLVFQTAEVAVGLDAEPKFRGLTEELAKLDRHFRSDRATSEDDLVDGPRRNAKCPSKPVLGDGERLEIFLQKDFARGDWIHVCNL